MANAVFEGEIACERPHGSETFFKDEVVVQHTVSAYHGASMKVMATFCIPKGTADTESESEEEEEEVEEAKKQAQEDDAEVPQKRRKLED
ncbi:hypothetical protein L596_000445 [Steinernema carpocapsae]|uniref:Uncharacterized protein n=1 Tax=Steinernema carpocapsae TaxID=34508 RepID=A0A4U8UMD2_STECR|nr:hypothetical protein L596_000445 [Steinernema carpocapsae]